MLKGWSITGTRSNQKIVPGNGTMNFIKTRQLHVEINLTPLIDVVFLLLIFFMISTSFTLETQIEVTLPSADGAQGAPQGDPFVVWVSAEGQYAINNSTVIGTSFLALDAAISAALRAETPSEVVVWADAEASHQSVITLLEVLQKAGQANVQLKTQSRQGTRNPERLR